MKYQFRSLVYELNAPLTKNIIEFDSDSYLQKMSNSHKVLVWFQKGLPSLDR